MLTISFICKCFQHLMGKGIYLIALLCLTSVLSLKTANGQTISIQGTQTGIMNADSVMLVGNVFIPSGATLTFLPGTSVISTGFFGFEIAGNIISVGSSTEPISFSVFDTTGFYNQENERGGWDGFRFINTDPTSDSSVFSYCNFSFGKAFGDSLEKMGGVFNIRQFSKIRISDCEFNHNMAVFWGGAVFAEYSNIIIHHSEFSGNFCGTPDPPYGYGGAICIRYGLVDLIGCNFNGNSSTGIGGAVSFEYSDVLLQSGYFFDNYSALGGALGYLRSTPVRTVSDNLFTGNSSLFFGGAISCNRANPRFINNTIANNSSVSYGGGFYCNDSAAPVLINTIIYDNYAPSGMQVYIWDVYSAPEFYYCDVQGGPSAFGGTGGTGFVGPYLNNLDTVPFFSGLQPNPFAIEDESPCINIGNPDTTGLMLPLTDLARNPRITGGRIDMGAYENLNGATNISNIHFDRKIRAYPNPFRENVTFRIPMTNENSYILISDNTGRVVFTSNSIHSDVFIWNGMTNNSVKVKPGVYTVAISTGNQKQTTTLIIIQ